MSSNVAPEAAALQQRARRDRLEAILTVTVLALVAWVYFSGVAARLGRLTSPAPVDYYGLQTEAFLSGQLHLKIPTDPRLLELENPYAGPQGTNRPHDMSFYGGRFYLYYGATPVLLLYLPWRLLTGTYLHEAMGTVVMIYGGFVLASVWLWRLRRREFPALSPLWLPALVLLLGFGAPLFVEAQNPTFYAVPIAGAFLCLMLAFTALDQALRATRAARQLWWLTLTSLTWGLAVAARPIYVAGLLVFAVSIAWLWWQTREQRWQWRGLRLWVAGVLPAAVIGVAMMAYNYLRFEHPLEFGIRFSMASADIREARLVGAEFIPKNLYLYLLKPADGIRYYPFIITNGRPYGVLPYLTFVVVAMALPLTWRHARRPEPRWILTTGTLAGAGLANLALLCLFFGGEERYLLDFAPPWLLAAAATALALLNDATGSSRRVRRLIPMGLALLAGYGLFTGAMLSLPKRGGPGASSWLEQLLNQPAAWLERTADVRYGPVELDVRFPAGRAGTVEPLLVTGHLAGTGDLITVHYLDEQHVQFGAFHLGDGGPRSDPLRIDPQKPYRLRIALGSLYPRRGHELWRGWSEADIDRVRRHLLIELDGEPVLEANVAVYASMPQGVHIGRNDLAADVAQPRFTGEILALRRTGVSPDDLPAPTIGSGPVRLHLRLPSPMNENPLPLISTGRTGQGDLLFVQRMSDGRLRFGHDNVGGNAVHSAPAAFDPGVEHVVEVEMGSLYPPDGSADEAHRRRLRVTFDGQTLIDSSRPFHPSAAADVVFGYNAIDTSSATPFFPGTIREVERIPPAPLSAGPIEWGPLKFDLCFPAVRERGPEPILVTGHTGRADVIFVTYEPGGKVRFSHDHWSIGVHAGEAFAAPEGKVHHVEIHSGALLPPADHPEWRQRPTANGDALRSQLMIRVDGTVVLQSPYQPYSNPAGERYLGANSIGASTCAPSFGGEISNVEWVDW